MVTINEVAKEAGVSITTVSRVLNNNYPVKEETKLRVKETIKKLNYKPNQMARSLITKKSCVIGVIVPGITNLFFPSIVEDIDKCVKDKGYNILLCSTRGENEEEKDLVDKLIQRQVDGIILIDPCKENLESGYYEKLSKEYPIIIVKGLDKEYKCNFICYDETIGTKEALSYLLNLNHKKIAFIRGKKSISYDIKERVYDEFLEEKKLDYKKILTVASGNSIEVVRELENKVESLLKDKKSPTAIFACNDLMATGVINVCRKLNLNVPEDISVIGCDNTLMARVSYPKLTSIDLSMKVIGNIAGKEIIDLINSEVSSIKKVTLDTKLIIRDSCKEI